MEIALVVIGGIVIALGLSRVHNLSAARDPFRQDSPTDVINVSRIRVVGIGGLGLVAMAGVVSFAVPSIGVPIAISAVLGIIGAALLIVLRRRDGGMRSSGARPGANTTLSIDAPDPPRR